MLLNAYLIPLRLQGSPGRVLTKTQRAIARHAGCRCSFTSRGPDRAQDTIAPSDEAPDTHANGGEAADLCTAAAEDARCGPTMTPDMRASIYNAYGFAFITPVGSAGRTPRYGATRCIEARSVMCAALLSRSRATRSMSRVGRRASSEASRAPPFNTK